MARRKRYNPEKNVWRGRSYKNGKRILTLKVKSLLRDLKDFLKCNIV